MPNCFVTSRPKKPPKGEADKWSAWRDILTAKQLGFTLDELRQLTRQDFVILTDLLSDESEAGGGTRDATQEDIDRLLG